MKQNQNQKSAIDPVGAAVEELRALDVLIRSRASARAALQAEYESRLSQTAAPDGLQNLEEVSLRLAQLERMLALGDTALNGARARCRALMPQIARAVDNAANELKGVLRDLLQEVIAATELRLAGLYAPEAIRAQAMRTTAVRSAVEFVEVTLWRGRGSWIQGPGETLVLSPTTRPEVILNGYAEVSERLARARTRLAELRGAS